MSYDSTIHHRRSIRLKSYDYAAPGIYYITLCTQHRLCLFGNIINEEMKLNSAGLMITKIWQDLPTRFKLIALDGNYSPLRAAACPRHPENLSEFLVPADKPRDVGTG